MVFPFSLAMGAKNRSALGPVASHCHPRLTTVKPLRSSHASPASWRQILIAAVDQTKECVHCPRLGTSRSMEPLPLCSILRTDGNEVGGELDLAVFQVHRIAEIDDAQVVRIGHREREVDASGDALIGSRIPEYLSVEDAGAGSHLHPNHPGVKRENGKEQSQKKTTTHGAAGACGKA